MFNLPGVDLRGILETISKLNTPVETQGKGVVASAYASKPYPKINSQIISPLPEEELVLPWYRSQYLSKYPVSRQYYNNTSTPTPTPTPTPMPTPTLYPGSENNPYMRLIQERWPQNEWNNANNVMYMENRGFVPGLIQDYLNPIIEEWGRPSRDMGLWQINDWWQRKNLPKFGYTAEDMLDPVKAMDFAYWLWQQRGWQPWYGAGNLGLR